MNKSEMNTYVYYSLLGYETVRVVHSLRTSLHAVTLHTNEVFYQPNGDTLKSRKPQYDYRYDVCITGVCTTK